MSSVRFINHACLLIESNAHYLLIDPWFFGEVFNRSWKLLKDSDLTLIDFNKLTGILFSHEHPDHLHFPTLVHIKKITKNPITIYFPERKNNNVQQAIEKLGFHYQEVPVNTKEYRLSDTLAFSYFSTHRHDHTIVFEIEDKILINQNDHYTPADLVDLINDRFPSIDILATQFSLAGYYANDDDHEGLYKKGTIGHLQRLKSYTKAFSPRAVLPFASFVYFCKQYNCYLNSYIVTPDLVFEVLGEELTQLCFFGDEILWDNWTVRTKVNLDKYSNLFSAEKKIFSHQPVELSELETSFAQYFHSLPIQVREHPICQKPFVVALKDYPNQFLVLSFRNGRSKLQQNIPSKFVDLSAPSDEVLFAFRFPWGMDTLNITGTTNRYTERSFLLTRLLNQLYIR